MQSQRSILPLVDMVFLALGAVLGCMTEMAVVHSIPVEVAKVGHGVVSNHEKFTVLTLTSDGMTLEGESITRSEILAKAANKTIVLRVDKTLPSQDMLELLADLVNVGAKVSLEVEETG